MLIIDGDYPMAIGAMDLNRDLTLPLPAVRGGRSRPLRRAEPARLRDHGLAAGDEAGRDRRGPGQGGGPPLSVGEPAMGIPWP